MADEIVRPVTVYGLRQKGKSDIRYIGQTRMPLQRRMSAHKTESKGLSYPKDIWIRSLLESGEEVEIFPLVNNARFDLDEIEQIELHRLLGHELLNVTGGGSGQMMCASKTRHKMSASAIRRFQSNKQRKSTSEATKKAMARPEVKEKMALACVRRWSDEKNRKEQSDRIKAYSADPEVRERLARQRAKMTDEQVIEARRLRRNGVKLKELCKMFDIAMGPMSMLCSGKTFKHLPM